MLQKHKHMQTNTEINTEKYAHTKTCTNVYTNMYTYLRLFKDIGTDRQKPDCMCPTTTRQRKNPMTDKF